MEVTKKNDKFLWLGNWPALDFVNTQIVAGGALVDLLSSGADLANWMSRSGLLSGSQRPLSRSSAALTAARRFRGELRLILDELVRHGKFPPSLLAPLNARLQQRNLGFSLHDQKGRYGLSPEWTLKAPADVCAPIALSFAELLSQADLARIRRCKNPECILFFYDASKSGTRSWCSLDICGNKRRVAAFRERHA